MTMNTRVHIAKPVNPEELFLHILGILEADPSFMPQWERPKTGENPFENVDPGPLRLNRATYKHVRKGDPWTRPDGELIRHATTGEVFRESDSEYRTTLGQGLACIWEVTYGSDGPLEWPSRDEDDDPAEPEKDYGNTAEPMPVHLVSANFDTAYGYKAANGAGCADLHAFLLYEIGMYLASVGCSEWVWHHEEKGTWHGPLEYHLRGNAELAAAHFGRLGGNDHG